MAAPNPDRPADDLFPPVPGAASKRPIPAAPKSSKPGPVQSQKPVPTPGAAPAANPANRPIPLGPKSARELPEAYDDDEEEKDPLYQALKNAPAWLVSTVFHMLLLVVLGLLAVGAQMKPAQLEIEVAYTDQLGTQLDDPSVLVGDSPQIDTLAKEQIIRPKDLPPVDDPLAAPPNLGTINLANVGTLPGLAPASSDISAPSIGLALSGRRAGSKNVLLKKYGGTRATEDAVEGGLAWLAKQQKTDGTWSLSGPYSDAAQIENNAAATAMALLAFQGHGDTHRDGMYAKNVAKGWTALLKMQSKDGQFKGFMPDSSQHLLYTHAQCAIAVCELYGMTQDSTFRSPAERAINFCVLAQDKTMGGWRYSPGGDSDTSVTGWFVMALQSARMAKLRVPQETLNRVSTYLDSAAIDGGRRYGYWQTSNPSKAMAAEGLLCREFLGWKQNDPRLVEGVGALNESPIGYDSSPNQDVYYWYYATQAAHHMEGKIWDDWNKVMRDKLPARQTRDGPEAGSWSPQGDKWGNAGGRLYVTCLSIYMLEVYYRHLPIYSGYRFVPEPESPNEAAKAAPEAEGKPDAKGPDAKGKDAIEKTPPAGPKNTDDPPAN